MKKTLIISTLLTASSMAQAQIDIYGGLGAGVNQFMPKRVVNDTIVLAPPLPYPTNTTKSQDGATGGDLSAFIGVKQRIDQIALGAELSGMLSSAETEVKSYNYNNSNLTAIARVRNKGNFSLAFLPGFYITKQTEAFIKMGIQRGRFEVKSAGDTGGNLIATGKTSRWLTGYLVGAGLETSALPWMNVRLDYTFSAYQSIKGSSTLPLDINFNQDQIQSKVTPYDHVVMLSFIFHYPVNTPFCCST